MFSGPLRHAIASERASSAPAFWDTRYAAHDALFGRRPSGFIARHAGWVPPASRVLDLGAGEARTLLWLARTFGHRGTAVDFADEGLATARRRAKAHAVSLGTLRADLRTWTPSPQYRGAWDAVLVSFLHLLPNERQRLCQTIDTLLRPGGVLLAEWFAPGHLAPGYDRIGPSRPDRMVSPGAVRRGFAPFHLARCEVRDVALAESAVLHGRAAVTQVIGRKPPPLSGPRPAERHPRS